MTKEQEAIERLNKLKNRKILYGNRAGMIIEEFKTLQEDIETVLNMIKEKEKQIDLMSEQLAGLTIWNNEKEEPVILGDKEEVKKYYERKSEE